MSRCLLMILVVAVFTGCGHSHELEWPDLEAKGSSDSGEEALYVNLKWRLCRSCGSDSRPAFSVRLPDGTVLTPDQITIDRTGAGTLGGDYGDWRRVVEYDYATVRLRKVEFTYATGGWLKVEFVMDDDAEHVRQVWAMGSRQPPASRRRKEGFPGSDLAVGNPAGTKLVVLPATRDELVELLGKPRRERKSLKDLCLPPSC